MKKFGTILVAGVAAVLVAGGAVVALKPSIVTAAMTNHNQFDLHCFNRVLSDQPMIMSFDLGRKLVQSGDDVSAVDVSDTSLSFRRGPYDLTVNRSSGNVLISGNHPAMHFEADCHKWAFTGIASNKM